MRYCSGCKPSAATWALVVVKLGLMKSERIRKLASRFIVHTVRGKCQRAARPEHHSEDRTWPSRPISFGFVMTALRSNGHPEHEQFTLRFSTSDGHFWLRRSKVPQDAEPSSGTSFSIEGLTLCDSLAFLLSGGFGVSGHHHFGRWPVLETRIS